MNKFFFVIEYKIYVRILEFNVMEDDRTNTIISPTSVWRGGYDVAKNGRFVQPDDVRARQIFKETTLKYPVFDHEHYFAMKPCEQKGRARLSQTFVVSFAYAGGLHYGEMERIRHECERVGLRMHYEPAIGRGHALWLVVFMDVDVDYEKATTHARELSDTLQSKRSEEDEKSKSLSICLSNRLKELEKTLKNRLDRKKEDIFDEFFAACSDDVFEARHVDA